jgi:hypothetical protein
VSDNPNFDALLEQRRAAPLSWAVTVMPPIEQYADERAEFLRIALEDHLGEIGLLAVPDAPTALTRREPSGLAAWEPVRYLERPGVALVPDGADPREGEALCVFLAGTDYAWRVVAGRTLPLFAHGPMAFSFPPLPPTFPWLESHEGHA